MDALRNRELLSMHPFLISLHNSVGAIEANRQTTRVVAELMSRANSQWLTFSEWVASGWESPWVRQTQIAR